MWNAAFHTSEIRHDGPPEITYAKNTKGTQANLMKKI